jgi:hypothetical protein
MRLLCSFVISALASIERLDEQQLLDDSFLSFWDQPLDDLDDSVRLPLEIVENDSPPELRAGMLWRVPYACKRSISIAAGPEYAATLRAILASGFVPSLNAMFRSGGDLGAKDPRYKSLHNAVRKFREGLEVSSAALHAMLDLRRDNELVTAKTFWKKFRTVIRPTDPLHTPRCDLIIWYKFVINYAASAQVKDLEIEEYLSTRGHVVYRPVGSALERIVQFELGRIKI